MNYIVMETFETYAVLLSSDGQFVKAANLNYEVGQTVSSPVIMRENVPAEQQKINSFRNKKSIIAAGLIVAAAVLFFFFLGNSNRSPQQLVADSSIYLTINPEVRLDLDEEGYVINVEGTNPDGAALLEGYELTSQDRIAVTTDLIDRAIDMGFLTNGDQISFRIDASTEQFQEYGVELRSIVTEYLDGRMSVTIDISSVQDQQSPQSEEETTVPPQEPESNQPLRQEYDDDYDDDDDDYDDDD